jgi:hypothetical protein
VESAIKRLGVFGGAATAGGSVSGTGAQGGDGAGRGPGSGYGNAGSPSVNGGTKQ